MWNSKYTQPSLGDRFGQWTIIEDFKKTNKGIKDKVRVQCDCGVIRDVRIMNLILERSTSCGHDQYIRTREELNAQKHNYHSRVGEYFGQFKMTSFKRHKGNTDIMTYTFECPNGHEHIITNRTVPGALVKNTQFKCWCEEDNPVKRLRQRFNLTLEEVGKSLDLTRERIRQYENQLSALKPLNKKVNLYQTNHQCIKESYVFRQLARAYKLTDDQKNKWIDIILNKTAGTPLDSKPTYHNNLR